MDLIHFYTVKSVRRGPATQLFFGNQQGEVIMGDKGKRDKGQREEQKQPKHSMKEKRKLKKDKKYTSI